MFGLEKGKHALCMLLLNYLVQFSFSHTRSRLEMYFCLHILFNESCEMIIGYEAHRTTALVRGFVKRRSRIIRRIDDVCWKKLCKALFDELRQNDCRANTACSALRSKTANTFAWAVRPRHIFSLFWFGNEVPLQIHDKQKQRARSLATSFSVIKSETFIQLNSTDFPRESAKHFNAIFQYLRGMKT